MVPSGQMVNIQIIFAYIEIVFILIEQIYGQPISAKLNTDVVLRCPYLSSVNYPIVWFGPTTSAGRSLIQYMCSNCADPSSYVKGAKRNSRCVADSKIA
jgi:hypothetical protein